MRKHFRYLLLMFVALLLPLLQMACSQLPQSSSKQIEPNDMLALSAKPAVVRVLGGCRADFKYTNEDTKKFHSFAYGSPGSGFFINSDGYIATYAVKSEEDCRERLYKNLALQLSRDGDIFDANDVDSVKKNSEIRNFAYFHDVILPAPDPKDDPLKQFEVKVSGGSLDEGGKDVAIIKIDIEDAPALELGNSENVKLDDVTVIGYPVIDATGDTYEKVLKDDSVYEASVSEGKVSNPNKKLKSNSPVLEINLLSVYGSAGSPVLNNQGKVIGIIAPTEADRNPFVNTSSNERVPDRGIPLAIPAKTIREFIQDSGTENKLGEIDQYYQNGLTLFQKGDFEGAKEKFEVVKDLFPQHSEIERLISDTNKNKVERWGKPEIVLWSVLGGIILGLLGLVLYLTQRKPRVVSQSSSPQPERRPRPPITGFPASNGVGQSWIELEGQGQRSELQLTREIHKIGRDPAWSDLEIPTSWEVLSRQHAILKREGSSYRIFDGDGKVPSRNGLMINSYSSVDVHEGYLLKPGDVLIIGKDPKEQVRLSYYSSTANQVVPETKMAK